MPQLLPNRSTTKGKVLLLLAVKSKLSTTNAWTKGPNKLFTFFELLYILYFHVSRFFSLIIRLSGGSVISIDALRYNSTVVIHELGHNLGLLHTHHGISEVSCSHSCRETLPSLSLGDLVQDTNPTPLNFECHDPFGLREYRVCDFDKPPFRNTPYRNFMGFGGELSFCFN